MNLSELIGQKVFTNDGSELGYSVAPVFSSNKKILKGLLCVDLLEREFFLPIAEDYKLIYKKNVKARSAVYSPVLMSVFTDKGEFIGVVSDVVLDGLSPAFLVVGENLFSVDRAVFGGGCVLIKQSKVAPMPVATLDLLGKRLCFDVFDERGELLFKKGIVVTAKVVRRAEEFKKVVELTAKCIRLPYKE